jgi:hypothetical protein
MLTSLSRLNGSTVTATDGEIGHVREAYFDDDRWAIRYLVIDTGTWLSGRDVLISPYAVRQTLGLAKNIAAGARQPRHRHASARVAPA